MRPSKARTAASPQGESDRRRVDQHGGSIGTDAKTERLSEQRKNPTGSDDEADHIRSQAWRHAARRERLQRAGALLLDGIAEAGVDRPMDPSVRKRFTWFASGLNRDQIAARAAGLVINFHATKNRPIDPARAERFVWWHLNKHFGWQDLRDLEVGGHA